MGTSSSESWAYVLIIVILALLFVLIIPVLGFMYMDIRQERILIANDIKRMEKLKTYHSDFARLSNGLVGISTTSHDFKIRERTALLPPLVNYHGLFSDCTRLGDDWSLRLDDQSHA